MSQPQDIDGRILTVGCHVTVVNQPNSECQCGECRVPQTGTVYRVSSLGQARDIIPPGYLLVLVMTEDVDPNQWLAEVETCDGYLWTPNLRRINEDHEPAGSWEDVMNSINTPTKVH